MKIKKFKKNILLILLWLLLIIIVYIYIVDKNYTKDYYTIWEKQMDLWEYHKSVDSANRYLSVDKRVWYSMLWISYYFKKDFTTAIQYLTKSLDISWSSVWYFYRWMAEDQLWQRKLAKEDLILSLSWDSVLDNERKVQAYAAIWLYDFMYDNDNEEAKKYFNLALNIAKDIEWLNMWVIYSMIWDICQRDIFSESFYDSQVNEKCCPYWKTSFRLWYTNVSNNIDSFCW
jgi:tetratricopeptide (TPR) repeat protein